MDILCVEIGYLVVDSLSPVLFYFLTLASLRIYIAFEMMPLRQSLTYEARPSNKHSMLFPSVILEMVEFVLMASLQMS
jgi:hypothetical protein